ncbi:hypothetical protein AB6F55_16325 [Providencia hangzhouensis]
MTKQMVSFVLSSLLMHTNMQVFLYLKEDASWITPADILRMRTGDVPTFMPTQRLVCCVWPFEIIVELQ